MEWSWFIEFWWRIPFVLFLFVICGYVAWSIGYNLLHPSPLSEEEKSRRQAQSHRPARHS